MPDPAIWMSLPLRILGVHVEPVILWPCGCFFEWRRPEHQLVVTWDR